MCNDITLQSEMILTGNSVIPAPHIVMSFTRVILRVQTETVCATDDPVTSINTSVTVMG